MGKNEALKYRRTVGALLGGLRVSAIELDGGRVKVRAEPWPADTKHRPWENPESPYLEPWDTDPAVTGDIEFSAMPSARVRVNFNDGSVSGTIGLGDLEKAFAGFPDPVCLKRDRGGYTDYALVGYGRLGDIETLRDGPKLHERENLGPMERPIAILKRAGYEECPQAEYEAAAKGLPNRPPAAGGTR